MTKLNGWKMVWMETLFCTAIALSTPAQTFNTLVTFDGSNGANPLFMSLVQGEDGDLYGTTRGDGTHAGTIFKITPSGMLIVLDAVGLGSPWAGLVLGTDHNFYGTTWNGGAHNGGTVFRMARGGR